MDLLRTGRTTVHKTQEKPILRALIVMALAFVLIASSALVGLSPAMAEENGIPLRAIAAYTSKNSIPEDSEFDLLGLEVLYRFEAIPAVAVNGTESAIESLRSDPDLDYIEYDEPLEYFLDTAVFSTKTVDVWNDAWWPSHIDRESTSPLMIDTNGDGVPDKAIDGDGVTIGIVDSGINALHPDLWYAPAHVDEMPWEPKVLECTSVSAILDPQVPNPYCDPTVGHGTHVAGIAGGTGWAARSGLSPTKPASAPPMGAAPGSSLVGAGLGAGIFIVDSNIALDWMFANVENYGIKVINNSWGGGAGCTNSFPGGTIVNITNRLVEEKDVVVVWAAGNYDDTGPTFTGPESRNPTPGVISVANYHDLQTGSRNGAVSTGSSDGCVQPQSAQDYIWTFPDVAAPGTGIVAPRSYTGTLNVVELPIFVNQDFGDVAWYVSMGGTSMAAPHVAGVVALIREANPELTAPEIEQILVRTATPWSDSVSSRGQSGTNAWWGAENSAAGAFVDPDSCKITPADAALANTGDTSVNAKFPRFTDLVALGHDANDFVCRDYRRGAGLVDAHAAVTMALQTTGTGIPSVKISSPNDGVNVDRAPLAVEGTVNRDAGTGPTATLDADTTQGEPPLTVDFTPGAAAGNSPLTSWSFDAGDGSDPVTGNWPPADPITHTYTDPGTPTASFTATDEDGLADTATVEVTVSSGASEERTLWLVGDGSTTVVTSPAPTNYGLSPDGHGDQETTYIAALGNNEVAENPFMPTFIGDDPVTLTGEKVTLTAFVNYGGIINELGDICPLDAGLFDRSGNPISPQAQAFMRPGLGPTEVQFQFTPTAGSYSGLMVQIGASGADCGRFPQDWKWGTDEFPARLTLADQDTGGGPGPASAPFASDKTGDSLTPYTDIHTVDTDSDDQSVEIKIQLETLQGDDTADSPYAYRAVINGVGFESRRSGGNTTMRTVDGDQPIGSAVWDAASAQVTMSLPIEQLEVLGIHPPYQVYVETHILTGAHNGLADDRAPDEAGFTSDDCFQDATGDSLYPGADVAEVCIGGETINDFKVLLHVDDLEQAVPTALQLLGPNFGLLTEYSTGFDYDESPTNTVRYQVQAANYLATVGGDLEPDVGQEFLLQVQGDTAPGAASLTTTVGPIDGTWDETTGFITWTVPKAEMDVITAPLVLEDPLVRGSENIPSSGDRIYNMDAQVRTWIYAAAGVGPGQTVWDSADGGDTDYTFTGGNLPPVAVLEAEPTSGDAPLNVAFDIRDSSDPEGGPMDYRLDFGDGTASAEGQFPPAGTIGHTYEADGSYTVTLTLTDDEGAEGHDEVPVSVGMPETEHVRITHNGVRVENVLVTTNPPASDSWSTTVDLSDAPGGIHEIKAEWFEADGTLLATDRIDVLIETIEPFIDILNPEAGSDVSDGFQVEGVVGHQDPSESEGTATSGQTLQQGEHGVLDLMRSTTFDFNSGAQGWTVVNEGVRGTPALADDDPSGVLGKWRLTSSFADSGQHWYIGSTTTTTYTPGTVSNLVSPTIGLPAATSGSLSFQLSGDVATGDQMRVQWKHAGTPGAFQELRPPIQVNHIDAEFNPIPQDYSIDLPEAALGNEIQLRFRFESQLGPNAILDFPWGYFIDNVLIDTQSEDVDVPTAPRNLVATPGIEQVALSWDAPADDNGAPVTGYNIHRDEEVLVTGHPTQSYHDDAVEPGTAYTYTVSALNIVGEGPKSSPATATPLEDGDGEGQPFAITHPVDGATEVPGDVIIEGDLMLDGGGSGGGDPEVQGRVVVASLDNGLNPYHDFFYETGSRPGGGSSPIYPAGEPPSAVTEEVLQELGIDEEHRLQLTRTGNWGADRNADAEIWTRVEQGRGELWYFEGTNLIATNKGGSGAAILPTDPHGTAVAGAALAANPQQVHISVKGTGSTAENWAFGQPWIDIVTTSYGPPASAPIPFHMAGAYGGVLGGGKLHFGAAENLPVTAQQDTTAGPWWTIGIAGIEEGSGEGKQTFSGNFVDFLADFTQTLPNCTSCTGQLDPFTGGTSFATPRAAGVGSAVVQEARSLAGHSGGIDTTTGASVMVKNPQSGATITNWEIRRALEEAATYNGIADWDPIEGVFDFVSLPVVDAAPYVQSGWGILSPSIVPGALQQLDGAEPNKSADACTYMMAFMESRFAYWDVVNVLSESWLQGDHPYIRCDSEATNNSQPFNASVFSTCELEGGVNPLAPPPYDILEVCFADDGTWLHATFTMNLILGDDEEAAPDSNLAWWDVIFKTDTEYILEVNGDLIYGEGGTGYNADLWRWDPTGGTTGDGAWTQDADARTMFNMDWGNSRFTVSVMLEDVNAGSGTVVTDTWAATWPNAFLSYTQPYDTVPEGAGFQQEVYGDDYVVGGSAPPPPPDETEVLVSLDGPEGFDPVDDDQAVLNEAAGTWSYAPEGDLPAGTYTATGRQLGDGIEVAMATITFTVGGDDPNDPPVIDQVTVSDVTHDRATVSWVTDRPATSRVDFGTTDAYGRIAQDLAFKTEHELDLVNLDPATVYHFQITSEDNGGLSSSTPDDTFQTIAAGDETVEVFVAGDLIDTIFVDTSGGDAFWGPVDVDSTLYPDGSLAIEAIFTDQEGRTASKSIQVVVENSPAEPPEFILLPDQEVNEGDLLEFTVEATDPKYGEADLQYSAQDLPTGALFHAPQRKLSWAPDFDQAGDYTVGFTVENPDGLIDVMEVNVTVVDVNRAPRITSGIQNYELSVKDTLEVILEAVDDDGDEITSFTLGPLPAGATFETEPMNDEGSQVQGHFNWTPAPHQGGSFPLTATVTDEHGDWSERSFTINVEGVNAILIEQSDLRRLAGESDPVAYTVSAFDSQGAPIDVDSATEVVWSIDDPEGGVFNENVFTPGPVVGEYTITAGLLGAQDVTDATTFTVSAFKNTQDGSLYADLQEAVDASGSGDTLIVVPGTYMQDVVIPPGSQDLTLCQTDTARDGCATDPDPVAVVLEAQGPVIVADGTTGATLQGLTLRSPGEVQLSASDAVDLSVLDNRFETLDAGRAIHIIDSAAVRIEGNTFPPGHDETVVADGGSDLRIASNLFEECVHCVVADSDDVKVLDNEFMLMEGNGQARAVTLGGTGLVLEDNHYTGPGTGTSSVGVLLEGGTNLFIYGDVYEDIRHAVAFTADSDGAQPGGWIQVTQSSFNDARYGLWFLSDTQGVHVDATGNSWGVLHSALIGTKIQNQGSGNSWDT